MVFARSGQAKKFPIVVSKSGTSTGDFGNVLRTLNRDCKNSMAEAVFSSSLTKIWVGASSAMAFRFGSLVPPTRAEVRWRFGGSIQKFVQPTIFFCSPKSQMVLVRLGTRDTILIFVTPVLRLERRLGAIGLRRETILLQGPQTDQHRLIFRLLPLTA